MNIYDISRRAGVSIATVSRVLNNSPHVSENTRRKVMAVIEGTGYVPNAFARGLGLNTMKTIGLLCPDASDPYLAQALTYLERSFRQQGYDCLLSCTGKDLRARQQGVDLLKSRHVDGIVLMGSSFIENDPADNEYIREAARNVPVVLLNATFPCENVYGVQCDDQQAVMEAVRYLLDSGRKRILFLYHSNNYSGRRKLAGYREAHVQRGLAVDEKLLCFFERDKGSVHQVCDTLLALEKEGLAFDAVLTSEDILSVGALKYARATKRRVPEELSVIGYNNSSLCACTEPELTSVDNKLLAICEHISATMIGVLEGKEMPQTTVFTGELVKRAST
ncbi:MAG: LacI family DNA-binding transcriptional regulator [Clostridiales bacterium]|nr:LacI family DNA-binding transcriptional regulator [Clostridiales bacterium]